MYCTHRIADIRHDSSHISPLVIILNLPDLDIYLKNNPKCVMVKAKTKEKETQESTFTFLACQQVELLIQCSFFLHLPHVFQGQIFIRRGSVRALVQSCHYDGERVRPNTDVHPTRNQRPLLWKPRQIRDMSEIFFSSSSLLLFLVRAAAQQSFKVSSWD